MLYPPPLCELLSPLEFTKRINWTARALARALAERRVFEIEVQGTPYLPEFLADAKYQRRQLTAIVRALGDSSGVSKLLFFTVAKGSLGGRTPLQALIDRDFARVKKAAVGYAER